MVKVRKMKKKSPVAPLYFHEEENDEDDYEEHNIWKSKKKDLFKGGGRLRW